MRERLGVAQLIVGFVILVIVINEVLKIQTSYLNITKFYEHINSSVLKNETIPNPTRTYQEYVDGRNKEQLNPMSTNTNSNFQKGNIVNFSFYQSKIDSLDISNLTKPNYNDVDDDGDYRKSEYKPHRHLNETENSVEISRERPHMKVIRQLNSEEQSKALPHMKVIGQPNYEKNSEARPHMKVIQTPNSEGKPHMQVIKKAIIKDQNIQQTVVQDVKPTPEILKDDQPEGPLVLFTHDKWLPNKPPVPYTLFTDFLINPSDLCAPFASNLDFVIVVNSATQHTDHRNVIRITFGQDGYMPDLNMRLIFLVGKSENETIAESVREEGRNFGDIVQGDFVDTYKNLTLKGATGLRWLKRHCRNTDRVLKIDDDVLVNLYQVVNKLFFPTNRMKRRIICELNHSPGIERVESGKWYVEHTEFPGLGNFPFSFCSGYFVLYTGDLILSLYNAAKVTPFFWIDDVYLFGMLPKVMGQFHFVNLFGQTAEYENGWPCIQAEGKQCSLLALNNKDSSFHRTEAFEFWDGVNT